MKLTLEILILGYVFINGWLACEMNLKNMKVLWLPLLSFIALVFFIINGVRWLITGLVKSY